MTKEKLRKLLFITYVSQCILAVLFSIKLFKKSVSHLFQNHKS